MRRIFFSVAVGALLFSAAAKADEPAAQVSFLQGTATRTAKSGGVAEALKKGAHVSAGDTLETADGARLEILLKDHSAVRLGPSSKMRLNEAHFGAGEAAKRQFSAKVFFGSLWAKATAAVGGDNKFDVETDNAVAGVRGTAFRVDAHQDKSVLVKVFSGAVAVAKNMPSYAIHEPGKGERKQVAGPGQVDRKTWEKLVRAQMMVAINSDGTPGDPVAFDPATERDEFTAWNEGLDSREEKGQ